MQKFITKQKKLTYFGVDKMIWLGMQYNLMIMKMSLAFCGSLIDVEGIKLQIWTTSDKGSCQGKLSSLGGC